MPRTRFLAIAAVAAFAITALATNDASARFGGVGGGHVSSHAGGGGVSRMSFHSGGNMTIRRSVNISRPVLNRPLRVSHVTHAKILPQVHHHKHPPYWAFKWCRHHHHHHWCHDWGIDVVDVEPVTLVAATPVTPAAAICTDGCDYLLNDGTGCYMAKRKFSTPLGDELRCVKMCDAVEPEVK